MLIRQTNKLTTEQNEEEDSDEEKIEERERKKKKKDNLTVCLEPTSNATQNNQPTNGNKQTNQGIIHRGPVETSRADTEMTKGVPQSDESKAPDCFL